MKKSTKSELNKYLKEMNRVELENEVKKLYSKFKDVKKYYEIEFSHGTITTVASAADLLVLRDYILGIRAFDDNINSNQWISVGDANGDGNLSFIDHSNQYLPQGSSVWGIDGVILRPEMTTEIQKTAAMIDGKPESLTIWEYNSWIVKF